MLLTFFKGERISKFNGVPLFEKEGLGEIYQSVIMKVRLTDQHYILRCPYLINLKIIQ